MGARGGPYAGLDSAEKVGRLGASGTEEDTICSTDEEVLQPLLSVLQAARASSEQMREWASWVREYSSRIDTHGIGNSHPEGAEEGRRERLETMRKSSPPFILRSVNLEQALKAAENGGERSAYWNVASALFLVGVGDTLPGNPFLAEVWSKIATREPKTNVKMFRMFDVTRADMALIHQLEKRLSKGYKTD